MTETKRIYWLDYLRVVACLMVMTVHATEPYYLGGQGTQVLTYSDGLWADFFDSFVRSCVPLFVIASSFLLFPLSTDTASFFRRRAWRILPPFILWSLVYACYWGEPADNLQALLLNFNYAAGHLWFVYMLIGLYLLMPMMSPWAERVGRRELLTYIAICAATTLIPFIREWAATEPAPVIHGPTGIPNPAHYPLWGEASWNAYGIAYYMSGFILYLLIGLYFRRFATALSWRRTLALALPAFAVGFAITFGGFLRRMMATASEGNGFPIEGPVDIAAAWETPWLNDTLGVLLMAVAWILLFRKLNTAGWLYHHFVLPVSKASYGMYLIHMLVLAEMSAWLRSSLGIGHEGLLGIWTTPLQITLTAVLTFALTTVIALCLQRLPRIGKYIIG